MSISYWQKQVDLPGKDTPLERPVEVESDVCIIGAGIIGAGMAHWAARAGLQGVVVDAREAALGASGRNAGFILSGIADNYYRAVEKYGREVARDLWALSIRNRDTMIDLAETLGVPLERCGSLLLAESQEEAEELARSSYLLEEDGFPGEFVARDPLNRGFEAALRREGDAVTQPAMLSRAVLAHSGFAYFPQSPVRDVREEQDGVTVYSERATVRARWVLLATNAWSSLLHPYFQGKVVPMRGQVYVTEPAPLLFHTAGYSHFGYWYFRQIPAPERPGFGRWLIGGGRHLHFASENNNLSEDVGTTVQLELEAWTRLHFPEFADLEIEHRWAGIMGFTPDGLPLVGRLPGYRRVAFAVGFNGHGMGLGIVVAKRALDLLLEEAPPGIFDAARLE